MSYSNPVLTTLNGYFGSDYAAPTKTILDLTGTTPTLGVVPPVETTIGDGRQLQTQEDDGKPDFEHKFFHKHGFVLLPHRSSVQNWDSGAFGPTDALQVGDRHKATSEGENEIESRYWAEVENLIRTKLLPGSNVHIQQPNMVLRRGKDTAHPFFGLGVHNDYGVSAEDFQENMQSYGSDEPAQQWRDFYESDNVQGFMVINFWRPVNMSKPLEHMPLAVLDSNSVDVTDLVSSGLKGFTHTGRITNQLSLRYNESQSWFYYPKMTVNEVLALKLFHISKSDAPTGFGGCYHSAFENPSTPEGVEERQSCEHRVNVFILNN